MRLCAPAQPANIRLARRRSAPPRPSTPASRRGRLTERSEENGNDPIFGLDMRSFHISYVVMRESALPSD
jgi:hypothetical protein